MDTELIYRETIMMRKHGATYAECAAHFGVSRQRIQQIVAPDKVTCWNVLARADHHCEECGKYLPLDTGHMHHIKVEEFDFNNECNILYLCIGCHKKKHPLRQYTPVRPKRMRPSKVVCKQCSNVFEISLRCRIPYFCGKRCRDRFYHELFRERYGIWQSSAPCLREIAMTLATVLEINLNAALSTRKGKES